MPVLARTLEANGISTVLVTNMPYWAEKIGVPRTLGVEFPFGHILGQPGEKDQQMRVIRQALEVLKTAEEPGVVQYSPEVWPEPTKEAYKAWQPKETSPIIKMLAPKIREMIREAKEKGKE